MKNVLIYWKVSTYNNHDLLITNLIHLPLTLSVISHMTCWLADQEDKPLDLRGEELSITFHIETC